METYTFQAKDNLEIYAYKWIPSTTPVAVLQLVHGSVEHLMRYEPFAERLVREQIVFYGMDLRGHGQTAEKADQMNLFSKQPNGWQLAIDDIYTQTQQILSDFPGLPVFIFGHSMGSLLVRDVISQFGDSYQGAILSGTGRATPLLTYVGLALAKVFMLFNREKTNPFLHNLIYGELNNKIDNPRSDYDFLSRDPSVVDAYIADPWCGQIVTTEYAHELVRGVLRINQARAYQETPKSLPIYLFSGAEDPVGGEEGVYVNEVAQAYQEAGVQDVQVKLYPGARHEMLNELNRDRVMADIIAWLRQRMPIRT